MCKGLRQEGEKGTRGAKCKGMRQVRNRQGETP